MILDLEREVEQMKTVEDLKPILRQIVQAINTLYDTKHYFNEDVVFLKENSGIVQRRQGIQDKVGDGNWVRTIVTGNGTSALTFVDLGKERS